MNGARSEIKDVAIKSTIIFSAALAALIVAWIVLVDARHLIEVVILSFLGGYIVFMLGKLTESEVKK